MTNRESGQANRSSQYCPVCESQALNERSLKNQLLVDVCPKCLGIWLDEGEILRLTTHRDSVKKSLSGLEWNTAPSLRKCPKCTNRMVEGQFIGATTMVDYCETCRGLWFDSRELKETLQGLSLPSIETDSAGVIFDETNLPPRRRRRKKKKNRPRRKEKTTSWSLPLDTLIHWGLIEISVGSILIGGILLIRKLTGHLNNKEDFSSPWIWVPFLIYCVLVSGNTTTSGGGGGGFDGGGFDGGDGGD